METARYFVRRCGGKVLSQRRELFFGKLTWIKAGKECLRHTRQGESRLFSPEIPMIQSSQLDETRIAHLVDCFYDKVSADPLLGAVFNPVVEDWDEHKRLLTTFWCSVALRAGTYRGNPMAMHRPHPIRREHFERWLALWDETTREVLDAEAAAVMIEYAGRIGQGLQLGLGLLAQPKGTRSLGIPLVAAPSTSSSGWIPESKRADTEGQA